MTGRSPSAFWLRYDIAHRIFLEVRYLLCVSCFAVHHCLLLYIISYNQIYGLRPHCATRATPRIIPIIILMLCWYALIIDNSSNIV